jgi:arylsulfatase A-like enzyme
MEELQKKIGRLNFLKAICFGIAGFLLLPGLVLAQKITKVRPNIIVIMADDLGFSDLGCYGSEIETPNLDYLANNGLRFTNFYNNAKCTPSRKSLLTGLYPQQLKPEKMENSVNIAQALKAAGYRTLMTGKNDGGIAGLPTKHGFDRFYGLNDGACNYFNPGIKRPGENDRDASILLSNGSGLLMEK